jgi:hypothetical protein
MSSIAQNFFGHESYRYIRQKPVCFLEQTRAFIGLYNFQKSLDTLNNLSIASGFVVYTKMSLTSKKRKQNWWSKAKTQVGTLRRWCWIRWLSCTRSPMHSLPWQTVSSMSVYSLLAICFLPSSSSSPWVFNILFKPKCLGSWHPWRLNRRKHNLLKPDMSSSLREQERERELFIHKFWKTLTLFNSTLNNWYKCVVVG